MYLKLRSKLYFLDTTHTLAYKTHVQRLTFTLWRSSRLHDSYKKGIPEKHLLISLVLKEKFQASHWKYYSLFSTWKELISWQRVPNILCFCGKVNAVFSKILLSVVRSNYPLPCTYTDDNAIYTQKFLLFFQKYFFNKHVFVGWCARVHPFQFSDTQLIRIKTKNIGFYTANTSVCKSYHGMHFLFFSFSTHSLL